MSQILSIYWDNNQLRERNKNRHIQFHHEVARRGNTTATTTTNNNNNEQQQQDFVEATGTVWLSSSPKRPTLYLPVTLASKYNMHKPCRVAFIDTGDGILIKFIHYNNKNHNNNNSNNNNYNNDASY